MKNNYLLLLLCNLVCFYGAANSISTKQNSKILIEQAYVRATIPGTSISSSYMDIVNNGNESITLLSVSSDISPRIEIHQHTMLDGMMRMRKLDLIDIKSKDRIKLQPSGLHLMLFDVKKPLNDQEHIELTLHFSKKKPITVQVPVYSPVQEKTVQKMSSIMHKHHH